MYNACSVVLLSSGDEVICITTRPNESYATLSFPYKHIDGELYPFLPDAYERSIDVMLYNVVTVKRLNKQVADKLFHKVIVDETDEFTKFVADFVAGLLEDSEDNRVLH